MVQSIIDLSEHHDRIINIVKAKFGLKNKSEAITKVVQSYEQNELEPELRPEYIVKIAKIKKEDKFIKVGTSEDFSKRYD